MDLSLATISLILLLLSFNTLFLSEEPVLERTTVLFLAGPFEGEFGVDVGFLFLDMTTFQTSSAFFMSFWDGKVGGGLKVNLGGAGSWSFSFEMGDGKGKRNFCEDEGVVSMRETLLSLEASYNPEVEETGRECLPGFFCI